MPNLAFRYPRLIGIVVASAMLAGTVSAQAVIVGGKGAPQSVFCKSVGGTEIGQFCKLENGTLCEAMTLFRDNACKGEDGEIMPLEQDFGTNLAPGDGTPASDESAY